MSVGRCVGQCVGPRAGESPRPARDPAFDKLSSSRMSLSLTQQWLRQNISIYSAKDRVYADVDALLPRQPTLRPKTDVYSCVPGQYRNPQRCSSPCCSVR